MKCRRGLSLKGASREGMKRCTREIDTHNEKLACSNKVSASDKRREVIKYYFNALVHTQSIGYSELYRKNYELIDWRK